MLEAAEYGDNSFVTLTYSDEHLPSDGSLRPRDLTLFLKRLRFAYSGLKIRYFGVGEYGDDSFRPHYHLALFGFPTCLRGITDNRRRRCCEICDDVHRLWGLGRIECGTLTEQSAAYVAGYVTKKMTQSTDPRLEGRFPEFARMSLRPGIGGRFMDEVASTLLEHGLEKNEEDVPAQLQHGKRKWPLGRYLRQQLRVKIGKEKNHPTAAYEQSLRLLPLQEAAKTDPINFSLSKQIMTQYEGSARNVIARSKLYKKRGTI